MLDNYDLWEQHERERERELQRLPKCWDCDEHIQDDHYYMIDGKPVCPDCLENYYRVENDIE